MYLRTSVQNSEPLTFLDLLELEGTTADGITADLQNCLKKHGLDEAFLKECMVEYAQMELPLCWAERMACSQNSKVSSLASLVGNA